MTSDDTLKRYVIITPHLQTRPVESRMLPAEVEKLTAGALVFEHSTADTVAPDEAETRRRARLRQTSPGRLTEVGEVQWYLKAMLHRECEAKEREASIYFALAPSTVVGDRSLDELLLAKYQLRIALCNIAYKDVLAVMLEGAPILESIQAPESTLAQVEYPSVFQDMPINPAMAREFKRITRLRRNVVHPTNPEVVEFDHRFMGAVVQARNRILRGE
ncbi:hypothetical protein FRC00_001112 [Tulasnella sp. 408]|nr:hypothetical protein FRC00_001112 [Tulasnella sp. 408]